MQPYYFYLASTDSDGARHASLGKAFHTWGATPKKACSHVTPPPLPQVAQGKGPQMKTAESRLLHVESGGP